MTINFAKRLGVDVHFQPQAIVPAPGRIQQTVVITGPCKFVEKDLDTSLRYIGYHKCVDYLTLAGIGGHVTLEAAALPGVEVKVLTAGGLQEVSPVTPDFESSGDMAGGLVISNVALAFAKANGTGVIDTGLNAQKITDGSATFVTAGVVVGDYLTAVIGGAPVASYPITSVVSETELLLDGTLTTDPAVSYVVSKLRIGDKVYLASDRVNEYAIANLGATTITVGTTLPTLSAEPFQVVRGVGFLANTEFVRLTSRIPNWRGNIHISYETARHDLDNEPVAFATITNVESVFGPNALGPENPLGYGLMKCIGRTGGTITIYAIAAAADTELAHLEVIHQLKIMRDTRPYYFIVPLSSVEEVMHAYKSFVDDMNKPEQRFACTLFWTPELIYKDVRVPLSATGTVNANNTLTDPNVDFYAVGVQPGDFVNVSVDDGAAIPETGNTYEIESLSVDGHTLTISGTFTPAIAVASVVSYQILAAWFKGNPVATFSERDQQAQAWYDYCKQVSDDHVWINFPDRLIDGGQVVMGYFGNCAYAGMVAMQPENTPLHRLQLLGFDGTIHANDYFTNIFEGQVHKIESGGSSMATQQVEGSPLIFLEQWTSRMDDQVYQYRSVIRNRDSIKMQFVTYLCEIMGRDNLTPEFKDKVSRAANIILARLKASGQVGRNALISAIEFDPNDRTNILLYLQPDEPYPAHTGDLFIQI